MARFHDAAFGNKLYSGRRRYITQYVGKYPLPRADTPVARRIATLAKELVEEKRRGASSDSCGRMESALDALVNEAYGVEANGVPQ
jgi:adenine-specific DNA-methyltransferase